MAINLKKCPFCGLPGQIKDIPTPFRHGWVGCKSCGCYINWKQSPAGAVKKWNRRWINDPIAENN